MLGFILKFILTAVLVYGLSMVLPGVALGGFGSAAVLVLVLGLLNAVVKPIFTLVTVPLVLLTLGLFLVVINALMLLLTSWVSTRVDLGWSVASFGTAILGALIVSVVSFLLNAFVPDRRSNRRRA